MQSQNNKRTKKKNRKLLIAIFALLVVLIVGGLFWWSKSREKPYTFINYNPPTKQEKAAGDEKKKEIVQESQNQPQTSSDSQSTQTKAQAEVIITSAAQFDQAQTPNDTSDDIIDIRAYIPNRYEKGTCTITLSKGSLKVVREAPAYPDTSYTICTNPLIKRSDLPEPGDWQVVVAYSSDAASGSAAQTIRGVK